MTGSEKNRREELPVHNSQYQECKQALLDLVWQSDNEYFIKSLYTYAKCLREAMEK